MKLTANESGVPILNHPTVPINYNNANPDISFPANTSITFVNSSDTDFFVFDGGSAMLVNANAYSSATRVFLDGEQGNYIYTSDPNYATNGSHEGTLDVV